MKRNKRKTFAYRPSDKIISRESIVSVILGAAGIIGYYLLLFGSIKTGGTSSPLSGAGGWILLVVSAIGLYFGIQSMFFMCRKLWGKVMMFVLATELCWQYL